MRDLNEEVTVWTGLAVQVSIGVARSCYLQTLPPRRASVFLAIIELRRATLGMCGLLHAPPWAQLLEGLVTHGHTLCNVACCWPWCCYCDSAGGSVLLSAFCTFSISTALLAAPKVANFHQGADGSDDRRILMAHL